jgi:hypothetical protein
VNGALRQKTSFAAHQLQRFLVKNRCKVTNKCCYPMYRLSLSQSTTATIKGVPNLSIFLARNSTTFHQIWSIFLLCSLVVSTTNFSSIFSQTKWVTEADQSRWLEWVQNGQRQAGPVVTSETGQRRCLASPRLAVPPLPCRAAAVSPRRCLAALLHSLWRTTNTSFCRIYRSKNYSILC